MSEKAPMQSTPFVSSTGEPRNPIYEGQFEGETAEQAEARLHWAKVAMEMARNAASAVQPGATVKDCLTVGVVDERAAFESHMRLSGYSNPEKHPDGSYVSSAMELWWQGWKARGATAPNHSEQVLSADAMADRFISWPLPASVRPDPCAMNPEYPHRYGTNLLTWAQAKTMFEYVMAAPAASQRT